MQLLYNHKIFLLFIGGLFSLLLTIAVIYIKQLTKRETERKRLEEEKRFQPEAVGDIDAKLEDSVEFKKPNIFQELTKWGIQPLLIISFISLFEQATEVEIIGTFFLVILTLFHEFYLAEKFSIASKYQFTILAIWIFFFFLLSYKTNIRQEKQATSVINTKKYHSFLAVHYSVTNTTKTH